jgi:hypothetical protein
MDRNQAKIKADLIDLRLAQELEDIDSDFESRGLASSGGRLRARGKAKIKAQLEKELLFAEANQTVSTSTKDTAALLNAIPQRDKRLKSVRRMAKLLHTGDIISPFRLAKCNNPKLTRSNYDYKTKKYLIDIENRIRTVRKYWKQHGFTVEAVNFPEKGYQLKPVKLH